MRVYEFSKKNEITSKEVLALLQENGFAVASHMSVLTDDALQFLENHYKKKTSQPPHEEAPQKKETKQIESVPMTQQEPIKKEIKVTKPTELKPVEKPVVKKEQGAKPTFTQSKVAVAPAVATQESKALALEPISLADFASKAQKPFTDVIVTLMKWGILSNKNQILTEDLVERLAAHYQLKLVKKEEKKQEHGKIEAVEGAQLEERVPVVVVMGHVDHGKTTLLDFIRNTRVAAREKGGITQHLGAYEAKTPQGSIVFLDTPGHEAFSKIRQRGIKVADIAILVVAVDDSVMPQTIEAIKHAQSMKVPIIVAINKIDKVDVSRFDVVKRDLTQHGLVPEEWGGDVIFVPLSAKLGTGVDKLLEMIILQSQIMELRADVSGSGRGYVLESKLEKGRGPVATVLFQHGNAHVGDYFVAGNTQGRITSMVDSYGKRIESVGPAVPVQVAGFTELPEAGDFFEIVDKTTYLKSRQTAPVAKTQPMMRVADQGSIKLIVKTDSNSSKEALLESIEKLSKKSEKGFTIINSGLGNVLESDVELAADTGSRIITLHVKTEPNAATLAQRLGVTIDVYDIIYKLLESLEELAERGKEIKYIRKKIGEAVVRKVFDIKNLGVIAGSYIKEGIFTREGTVVAFRSNKKIGGGKIVSLQRDKKNVKEVHTGYECAFMVEGFNDWEVDDRVECYIDVPEK